MAPRKLNSRKNRLRTPLLVAAIAIPLLLVGLELGNVTNFVHRGSTVTNTGPTPEEQRQAAAVDADKKKDAIENPPDTKPSSLPTGDTVYYLYYL